MLRVDLGSGIVHIACHIQLGKSADAALRLISALLAAKINLHALLRHPRQSCCSLPIKAGTCKRLQASPAACLCAFDGSQQYHHCPKSASAWKGGCQALHWSAHVRVFQGLHACSAAQDYRSLTDLNCCALIFPCQAACIASLSGEHVLGQVREACSILDIDVEFFPCPKNGPTWRPQVSTQTCTAFHCHKR